MKLEKMKRSVNTQIAIRYVIWVCLFGILLAYRLSVGS